MTSNTYLEQDLWHLTKALEMTNRILRNLLLLLSPLLLSLVHMQTSPTVTTGSVATGHRVSSIHLHPTTDAGIVGVEVIGLFSQGWRFSRSVEVYGYTATDDLWTIIKRSTVRPRTLFDEVRLDLVGLTPQSPEWHSCIKDIQARTQALSTPHQLIID